MVTIGEADAMALRTAAAGPRAAVGLVVVVGIWVHPLSLGAISRVGGSPHGYPSDADSRRSDAHLRGEL